MITVRGKIENGKVLALEPVDESFEGREVTITFEEESNGKSAEAGSEKRVHWQHLMDTIRKNIIETEITDLAHQHDHYLYGTPKRED